MQHKFRYKVIEGGAERSITFDGECMRYTYDSWVFETRHNRRLCDFRNAVRQQIKGKVIVIENTLDEERKI